MPVAPEMAAVERPQVTMDSVNVAISLLENALLQRLDKKGYGSFAGKHEILGILDEEFDELKDAIRDDAGGISQVKAELIDIAVGCLFGVACIDQGVIRK